MENTTMGMSPADFSALMGNHDNNGFGGVWYMMILFLFVTMFGGGNFFGNRGGEWGQYATAASQQEILFGQQFQNLDNKIDRVANGICDSTFALNNTIINEGRGLGTALCNIGSKIDQGIGSIIQALMADGEKTRGLITANEIQQLRDKVSSLEMENRMCGVVRYPNAYTYNAGPSPFCLGAGHGCGANI